VLRPGGIAEVDVPNAASFRNRSRMLRGKHITNNTKPISCVPNRSCTRACRFTGAA